LVDLRALLYIAKIGAACWANPHSSYRAAYAATSRCQDPELQSMAAEAKSAMQTYALIDYREIDAADSAGEPILQ